MKALFSILAVFFLVVPVFSVTPSPQQMQMFLSLPKAQQRALAAQYGVDLDSVELPGQGKRAQAKSSTTETVVPNNQGSAETNATGTNELGMETSELDDIVRRCYARFEKQIVAKQAGQEKDNPNLVYGERGVSQLGGRIAKDAADGRQPKTEANTLERDERLRYINIESILKNSLLSEDSEEDPVEVCIRRFLGYKWTVKNELAAIEAEIEEINEAQKDLELFGYALFKRQAQIGGNVNAMPVPLNYVLGSGDTLLIQLFGKENASYELTIDRDGRVQFPDLGPFNLAGMVFDEARKMLLKAVDEQMIGVKANVTLGDLRSIAVFVMGEVERPGSYSINALSTVTQAIYQAGGLTEIGSLRSIQVKRQGKLVTELDLYDLMLRGDFDNDARLLPGDVVFIPTIGKTVSIGGEVRRPAIYELKAEKSLGQIIELAGGLTPEAYAKAGKVRRIDDAGNRTVLDINLASKKGKNEAVRNGDEVNIPTVLDKVESTVLVTGHVHRPGGFAWSKGMRVNQILKSINQLKPNPDLKYALIKREIQPTREIRVIRINLKNAIQYPKSRDNLLLAPRDEIIVFGLAEPRTQYLKDLIESLVGQASYNQYPKIASIVGNVRFPDTFPLYEGMTLKGLVESAFDIRPDTDMDYVIVKRRRQNIGKIEIINISIASDDYEQFLIKPLDEVYVLNLNEDRSEVMRPIIEALKAQARKGEEEQLVQVQGDVRFPGEYPLLPGVRVNEIIAAAGGLNESAYVLEAEVTRTDFTDPEKLQITHRVIDLNAAMKGDESNNIVLFPKDRVLIKQIPNWQERLSINIMGEVRFPGRYTFRRGETLSGVLERAGGLTEFAHPKAAVFTREELRVQEAEQIRLLEERMKADIAAASLEEGSEIDTAVVKDADDLLAKLSATEAVGRLVINLPAIIENSKAKDITLRPGDNLFVPASKQSVSVIGEVQFTSSHLFESNLSLQDYLNRAGGLTQKADRTRIYIVKASGSVVIPSGTSSWFMNENDRIEPGDTVVVPIDSDRVKPLTAWTKVTQIIYQVGLAAAAIASL